MASGSAAAGISRRNSNKPKIVYPGSCKHYPVTVSLQG
jgi:hypothetical protein